MSTRQVMFGEQVEEPRELEEAAGVKPTFEGIRDLVRQISSDCEILQSVLTLAERGEIKDPPDVRGGTRGPAEAVDIAMTTMGKNIREAVWEYENVHKSYSNWLKHSKGMDDAKRKQAMRAWGKMLGKAWHKLDMVLEDMG